MRPRRVFRGMPRPPFHHSCNHCSLYFGSLHLTPFPYVIAACIGVHWHVFVFVSIIIFLLLDGRRKHDQAQITRCTVYTLLGDWICSENQKIRHSRNSSNKPSNSRPAFVFDTGIWHSATKIDQILVAPNWPKGVDGPVVFPHGGRGIRYMRKNYLNQFRN